jgi:two-component system, sensor histidine kinase
MARILLAEDSPDIRVLVQMLLESAGHEVTAVSDGREAVTASSRISPDLILMDLSLPILTGWEAAREIRSNPVTAGIPILAVTAHAMQGDRDRALAAGCDGFIAKPIDEESFAARIGEFLASRPTRIVPPSEVRRSKAPEEPGRILVVDDQPDVARLLQDDLAADGHEVLVAVSREEALRCFEGDGRIDLAVVDVMLGGESGYALTEKLTAVSPEYVPVLLVTAGTIDREKGYLVGADDFIGKPIETVELRARARSLIRVGRAIREQRRIGRERSEAYQKLAELDRLKSHFLSTVSHELRTPLNTIILLAHQLEREVDEEDGGGKDRRVRDARLLRESAETLRRMINNILDLAKLEAGQSDLHPQRVLVREFLQETVNLIEPQARAKGIELAVQADPALPRQAVLDREKLQRVLINLLSNAVKYTDTGGVILRASPWQESIGFEVEDTGCGIPAELIASAFEPFRQIRPRSGEAPRGTGLGLTISKQLVEVMGGDLLLDSKEGVGTRVSFTLPLLEDTGDEAALRATGNVRIRPRGSRKGRILIVEDDPASRYGLKSLLESEGYQVAEAEQLAAIESLLRHSPPDLVVLDITLPDGDGAVWLQQRGDRSGLPPVIALTGVTADEDTRRIESAGVRAILTKPVNVRQLLNAVEEALE